jgi:serine/threonine protein phosphatase PrpC
MAASGASSAVAMIDGNRLFVGNCGDCRVLLGRSDSRTRSVVARPLSQDHVPLRGDERERIERSPNGAVCSECRVIRGSSSPTQYVCMFTTDHSGDDESDETSATVTLAVPMTRSIGHLEAHSRLGLSAEGEVQSVELQRGTDLFLVLASRSLWWVLNNSEVVDIVARAPNPLASAKQLISAVQASWRGSPVSSITSVCCTVVWFRWMSEVEARGESRKRERKRRLVSTGLEEELRTPVSAASLRRTSAYSG